VALETPSSIAKQIGRPSGMAAFGATNPTAMTAAATRAYEGSHGRVVRS
jgi:hypothetical protein